MILINNNALVHNAEFFRAQIGNACKLCAVVKCNAYSHGIAHCSDILNGYVDMFAVGSIKEANTIGNNKDVLVLMPLSISDMVLAIKNRYIIVIDSVDSALRLASIKIGKARVHLKIDSGMSRLGLYQYELDKVIDIVADCSVIEGIFSHFASCEAMMSSKQYEYFAHCCHIISRLLGYMPIRHICNTANTLVYRDYHLDMVRIGLGLYGYGHKDLICVKSVFGRVIATKSLHCGDVVSYDMTYVVPRDTNIAIIDVGYYNGIPQCGECLVECNGRLYKVVGKTCMGMIIIDTCDTLLRVFDKVTIIGNNTTVMHSQSIYQVLCHTRESYEGN